MTYMYRYYLTNWQGQKEKILAHKHIVDDAPGDGSSRMFIQCEEAHSQSVKAFLKNLNIEPHLWQIVYLNKA